MSGYLLDTNVISELRRPRPHGGVLEWIGRNDNLYLSAVSIGEIQSGIERTRKGDPEKAASLERWLNALPEMYKVLPMDAECFREWGRLIQGHSNTKLEDAMIAATARVHGLTVVTRNSNDFSRFGVALVNPFAPR